MERNRLCVTHKGSTGLKPTVMYETLQVNWEVSGEGTYTSGGQKGNKTCGGRRRRRTPEEEEEQQHPFQKDHVDVTDFLDLLNRNVTPHLSPNPSDTLFD